MVRAPPDTHPSALRTVVWWRYRLGRALCMRRHIQNTQTHTAHMNLHPPVHWNNPIIPVAHPHPVIARRAYARRGNPIKTAHSRGPIQNRANARF